MRHILLSFFAVATCMSLFSCNESRYPIDEKPSVKNDARLLGTWKITGKKDRATYTMSTLADNTYKVMIAEKNSQPEQYTAYLSNVKNNMFLNLQGKDDQGNKYILLRILDVSANGEAHVTSIADTTMRLLKSAKEVRVRISSRLNDPTFYEDTVTFSRIQ